MYAAGGSDAWTKSRNEENDVRRGDSLALASPARGPRLGNRDGRRWSSDRDPPEAVGLLAASALRRDVPDRRGGLYLHQGAADQPQLGELLQRDIFVQGRGVRGQTRLRARGEAVRTTRGACRRDLWRTSFARDLRRTSPAPPRRWILRSPGANMAAEMLTDQEGESSQGLAHRRCPGRWRDPTLDRTAHPGH